MDDLQDNTPSDALTAEETAAWEAMKADQPVAEPAAEEVKAEPEAKVEPADTLEGGEKEPEVEKLVKHGAFEEERQRRKKAQQEAQVAREEMARLRGQLEAIQGGKKPEEATAQEKIDIEKDPIGALKALEAKIAAKEAEGKQSEAQRAEFERISAIGSRHAEKFAKAQPHFFDSKDESGKEVQGAYSYMRSVAFQKLQSQYPGANRQQIIDAVDAVERTHIQECMQSGENAAEKLWELAVDAGYKAPQPPAQRNDKGQFKSEKTEAEKVVDIEKVQKASKSLGSVPAGGGDGPPSLEALADMDEDEFAEYTKGKKWEKLHRNGVI
jgi:hypothetical protein